MRKLAPLAVLLLLGCEPTPQVESPPLPPVEAPTAAGPYDDTATCEQNGGSLVIFDAVGTDGFSYSHNSCKPPETEQERRDNIKDYQFRKSCEDAGGTLEIDYAAKGEKLPAYCAPVTHGLLQQCSTSADCEGSCVKNEIFQLGGSCGPKRPLAGCFTEAGTNPPKQICAE